MDMVERVAMAIAFGRDGSKPETYAQFADMIKDDLRRQARAAIEAMRTPTEEMRHAGFSADAFRTPMARMETDFEPKAVFEAMIDAALSPSGEK